MGRISVPQIPPSRGGLPPIRVLADGVARFAQLLEAGRGKTLIISGAGMSVDSGIRAYRGERGSYSINKSYRPIFYSEFVTSSAFRQRYWARSYLGYTPVQMAEANVGHYAVAALMRMGLVKDLITQNVDRLHHKAAELDALPGLAPHNPFLPHPHILELHGTLKHVHCINCGHHIERDKFQVELSAMNPDWAEYAQNMARHGTEPRTNPDGDVDLRDKSYESFRVPPCPKCEAGILKPTVTFFGESLVPETRIRADELVEQASSVVVLGSALATYSAYRLVREAKDRGIEVGMVNLGVSRADAIVDWKIGTSTDREAAPHLGVSEVLRAVGGEMAKRIGETGVGLDRIDEVTMGMLRSGVKKAVDGGREQEPAS